MIFTTLKYNIFEIVRTKIRNKCTFRSISTQKLIKLRTFNFISDEYMSICTICKEIKKLEKCNSVSS